MTSPVERLLEVNQRIIEVEDDLARERVFRRLARLSVVVGPVILLLVYAATAATWQRVDLNLINIVLIPAGLALTGWSLYYLVPDSESARRSVKDIELELDLLRERKRLQAADLALDARYRRSAYKEQAVFDTQRYRRESTYYRRVHNILQSVIIVGSLATTTVAGLSVEAAALRWATVASSFMVGIAAGFTGYFKFRERSFYLQQTADAIDQEWNAVELGIGKYRTMPDAEAILYFVEEVEKLKIEQRKREQNLEQPPEGREQDRS